MLFKAANSKNYSVELQEVIRQYGDDCNEIEPSTQLQIFSAKFATEARSTLKEAIDFLRSLSARQRTFFKQVCRLAQLIIVLPSTNAASERSFGQERLNHLMILAIYKDLFEKLDLISTANEFVHGSEHRFRVFGKFE